MVGFTKKHL